MYVRFVNTSLAVCGANTACTNTIGSYTCPCLTGFDTYVPGVGCQDIDECVSLYCYYSYTEVYLLGGGG
jgi:hypothetical protein